MQKVGFSVQVPASGSVGKNLVCLRFRKFFIVLLNQAFESSLKKFLSKSVLACFRKAVFLRYNYPTSSNFDEIEEHDEGASPLNPSPHKISNF